ncbi:hypothetical protein SAMN05660443_0220 [Marinospirillum celere]|uniref:Uncharacterized protein n=1 Tax=Marinospirillum celere TaxID=1122252 RepID=A0A1I1DZ86_9GAMM|nr:hypothetical protein [Marinospirillum celere]SFB80245.1 hypothetical protein SAMN05660443_0220 [Marinospirillum celere]
MRLIAQFETKAGMFYLGRSSDGRFHPIYNNQSLGSYINAYQAAEDLALNVTFSALHESTGELLDTSALGLPADPNDWERIK